MTSFAEAERLYNTVRVGDEIYLPGAYPTHGASLCITKVNRRSIKAVERKGSYKPGTEWYLAAGTRMSRETRLCGAPFVRSEWFDLGDNGAMNRC